MKKRKKRIEKKGGGQVTTQNYFENSFDFVKPLKGSWGLHLGDAFRELLMFSEESEAQNEKSEYSVHANQRGSDCVKYRFVKYWKWLFQI